MAQGLHSSLACGIFPDQGLNSALAARFLSTSPLGKSPKITLNKDCNWDHVPPLLKILPWLPSALRVRPTLSS